MSGNRMKLKNELLLGALLSVTFVGYGLEKKDVDTVTQITQKLAPWAREFKDPKTPKTLPVLLSEFDRDILNPLEEVILTLPDVPPADALLKTMLCVLATSLRTMHEKMSKAKTLAELKNTAGDACSFKTILDKAVQNLDVLIGHVDANPDDYAPDAIIALKEYRKTTFQKFYDEWHRIEISHFLPVFMTKYFKGRLF